jgi:hypothetical protein
MSERLAFIKFCGLASSGIEKYLQTIALLLYGTGYKIDYYYTNNCPFTDGHKHAENSDERKNFLEQKGINLIQVNVDQRVGGRDELPWVGTNFFDLFCEEKYAIATSGGRGVEEFPFNKIFKTKIINTVHGHYVYLQPNVQKYVLICKWQANLWLQGGGDPNKMVILPPIIPVPEKTTTNLRTLLNIPEDVFVFGMHQGARGGLFSPNCLAAYKKIESNKNFFIMLGGEDRYRHYAHELGIKNIKFIESTSNVNYIHSFLNTLNVFAHSRADGEVCSSAIIEALYHGLPVLSHPAGNMGHAEQIVGNGLITSSIDEYANEMLKLQTTSAYYEEISNKALEKYNTVYEYNKLKQKYIDLYQNILQNN